LIVADPGSDLPSARADAQELARRLAPHAPIVLVGDAASRQSVLANLEQSALFYYAGHGEPSDFDGTSGLPLAFGERLLPSDVLALPRAPELVVLAACDAGRLQSETRASGWSVAHAFVLAGARQVVAPVRPVNDRAASTLGRALFEGDRAVDLVAGLTRAARSMRATALDGWAPFRVYVP
jgi:CHAT domain-containing protein